jgi:hypothetical protein
MKLNCLGYYPPQIETDNWMQYSDICCGYRFSFALTKIRALLSLSSTKHCNINFVYFLLPPRLVQFLARTIRRNLSSPLSSPDVPSEGILHTSLHFVKVNRTSETKHISIKFKYSGMLVTGWLPSVLRCLIFCFVTAPYPISYRHRRESLSPSNGPNWEGSTCRRRQNPVSETWCFLNNRQDDW